MNEHLPHHLQHQHRNHDSQTNTTNTMTHQLPPEVRVLTEDDIYRTSSQFRLWSFSPESLAERRRKTHEIAIERIERQRNHGANGASNGEQEKADYLTEEEELRLVQRYCDMIRVTNDHLNWPANVKVQYFLHPCLQNSQMLTLNRRRPQSSTCAGFTCPTLHSPTRPKRSTKPPSTSPTKQSPMAFLSPHTRNVSPQSLKKSSRANTKSYRRCDSHSTYGSRIADLKAL